MATPEQLLKHLHLRGPLAPQQLRELLDVSASTVTRLARQLGPERLVSLGRTRSQQYAATRTVEGLGSHARVLEIGEDGEASLAGTLHFLFPDGTAFERADGRVTFHGALPWFLEDARPQGFLGRSFVMSHRELNLPPITGWQPGHTLLAMAMRGEDLSGNLVLGEVSAERFFRQFQDPELRQREVAEGARAERFPQLAQAALAGNDPGSSAGGEQAKFSALLASPDDRRRWVLVKFSPLVQSDEGRRWGDLLVCEHLALQLLRERGLPAAASELVQAQDRVFLQVERFDRVGVRGRRPLASMHAIDAEFIGGAGRWSRGAERLVQQRQLPPDDAHRVALLEAFGRRIANNDQHLGNLSFFYDRADRFRLAPIYDMLPMAFRPVSGHVVDLEPPPPLPDTLLLPVWKEARMLALEFWDRVCAHPAISARFRACAERMRAVCLA